MANTAVELPPSPPAPRQPVAEDRRQSVQAHGWLLLVGGAAVVAGVFLPWITAQIPYTGPVTANGVDFQAWVPLGGGCVLVLAALQVLTSTPEGTRNTWPIALVAGVATAVLSAPLVQSVTDQLGALDNQDVLRADYGIGLWLGAAGISLSILATVGGWGATHRATRPTRH